MYLGVDVSTYFEVLKENKKYFYKGKEIDPFDVFSKNNVDIVRIRLWVDPYDEQKRPYLGGTCDLDNFILLAKVAKKHHMKICLDFHYSDFWCDPSKQTKPKAWNKLSFNELNQKVYDYTKEVLLRTKKEHIDISLIQIGNEITNGMLWPDGKLVDLGFGQRGNFENLATLLKSGIRASKEIMSKAKTIIHLEKSYDNALYREYFDKLKQYDVDYDIIGVSYYPYWHGTFEQVFFNIDDMKSRYSKPVMVMETGYGFTLQDYIKSLDDISMAKLVINEEFLKEMKSKAPFPLNEDGQADFVRTMLLLCKKHDVQGVFYWEPAWLPGDNICWASKEGQKYILEDKPTRNEWANQCLFDYNGVALKAIDEFKK